MSRDTERFDRIEARWAEDAKAKRAAHERYWGQSRPWRTEMALLVLVILAMLGVFFIAGVLSGHIH